MVHFKEWQWLSESKDFISTQSFISFSRNFYENQLFHLAQKFKFTIFIFLKMLKIISRVTKEIVKIAQKKNLEIISEKSLFRHTVSI